MHFDYRSTVTVGWVSIGVTLSILTTIFPGEPGLAGFTGANDGGSGDDDNWSYETCKVKSSSPTNLHPSFYRPNALPVAQTTVSKH